MKLAMESQDFVYTHIISCKQLIGKVFRFKFQYSEVFI